MGVAKNVKSTTAVFTAILALGLVGLLFLIIFGNLSGNLGFAANTQGANDTNDVIGNLTAGAVSFFSFSNVWFTLLAITLLIIIVIAVIAVVSKTGEGGGRGGFSS